MPVKNEREFISEVERANPEQFARILRSASGDEERILRTHLGDSNFDRMQGLARTVSPAPTNSVIMLPGILGSELHEGNETIWIDAWSIIKGDFDQLQVNIDGSSVKSIQAPAMLKKYYGTMQMALMQQWRVVAFPYDWRLDIATSARQLKAVIDSSVSPTDKLRFAAHSMGGLVVRSLLQQFPDQWSRVERFIMMGTPNYGSFAIPVLYNGLNSTLKLVAFLDQTHYMPELLQFAKMFVGTYEMLPFIGASPDAARLYDPPVYGDLNPPPERFDFAKAFQKTMTPPPKNDVTCYIAGYNQNTVDGIADWSQLQKSSGYHRTLAGDGTVPHSLGLIPGVLTYFVEAEHSSLPGTDQVVKAVADIFSTGSTTALPTTMPTPPVAMQEALHVRALTQATLNDTRAHLLAGIVRLEKQAHPEKISASEAELRDMLFAGFSKPSG